MRPKKPKGPSPNVTGAPLLSSETTKFQWWRIFDDSILDGLIADAFSEYTELKRAAANLESVRAAIGAERAALFPATTISARAAPRRRSRSRRICRASIIVQGQAVCPCCGSIRFSKIGEDVTETLEVIPCQYKVIETGREKVTCRNCEKISQASAVPRDPARPCRPLAPRHSSLYKFGLHQPLNRQSE